MQRMTLEEYRLANIKHVNATRRALNGYMSDILELSSNGENTAKDLFDIIWQHNEELTKKTKDDMSNSQLHSEINETSDKYTANFTTLTQSVDNIVLTLKSSSNITTASLEKSNENYNKTIEIADRQYNNTTRFR